MPTLQATLELQDKMSKKISKPLDKVSRLNSKLTGLGGNSGFVEATMQAQEFGKRLSNIPTNSLSEAIDMGSNDSLSNAMKQVQSFGEQLEGVPTNTLSKSLDIDNNSLARAIADVQSFGEKINGISTDTLSDAIDIGRNNELINATRQVQELGSVIVEIPSNTLSDALDINNNSLARATVDVQEFGIRINEVPIHTLSQALHIDRTRDLINATRQAQELRNIIIEIPSNTLSDALDVSESDSLAGAIIDVQEFSGEINGLNNHLLETTNLTNEATRRQSLFNKVIGQGKSLVSGLSTDLKAMAIGFVGLQGIRGIKNQVQSWLGMANARQAIEVPFEVSMQNLGATKREIDSIRNYAVGMGDRVIFGDDMFLAGATELARHVESAESITMLNNALADFTAGASGLNATAGDMASKAQVIGMALQGNYRQLERKGFALSETQKDMLYYGTELERVAIINDVVARSFGGLAEALSNTPEAKMMELRGAIAGVHEEIGLKLQPIFLDMMGQINKHLPKIEAGLSGIGAVVVSGTEFISNHVVPAVLTGFNAVGNGANLIADIFTNNWGMIEPVIVGVTGALVAHKLATIATTKYTAMLSKVQAFKTAQGIKQITVTNLMTIAQKKLNKALLANPKMLVVAGIGAVIAMTARWIQSTGGIHNAWLEFQNMFLSSWEFMQRAASSGSMWVQRQLINMGLGFWNFNNGALDALGNLKVGGLTIVQNMVNGAIGMINDLINAVNGIPLISISAIEEVSFATRAGISTKARQDARNNLLGDVRAGADAYLAGLDNRHNEMVLRHEQSRTERQNEINRRREALAETIDANAWGGKLENSFATYQDYNYFGNPLEDVLKDQLDVLDNLAGSGANTARNTGLMASEINISKEDLRYLRDIAEKEAINYITTNTIVPQLQVNVENIRETADLDEVLEELERKVKEELFNSTEGVYA